MGGDAQLRQQIKHLGRNHWLEQQLHPKSIDDPMIDDLLAERFPDLEWSLTEAWNNLGGSYDTMYHLGYAAIARAVWSKRQLFEVMVDFWSNHINVANFSDNVWWSRHDYDAKVIRKHAMGKYSDMLAASAQHPAMMIYLNNAESSKYGLNENYGRELLELHSVGVDGGYSEEEMLTSAKIMTGFGMDWNTGLFIYRPDWHYTGYVKVLGWSSQNADEDNGLNVGLKYVDYLAHHRKTAERIATKLCERFVSDNPPKGLVDHLADTYKAHDTAIVPVLRELFNSKAFKDSVGVKVRRPFQDVVATYRILNLKPEPSPGISGFQNLHYTLDGLGDLPLTWPQPNGYPDRSDDWRSAGRTLGRWNMHYGAANHGYPTNYFRGTTLDELKTELLPKTLPKTHGKLVNDLASRLVFRDLTDKHRDAILTFLGKTSSSPLLANDAIVNSRFGHVVALILDSPYHGIR